MTATGVPVRAQQCLGTAGSVDDPLRPDPEAPIVHTDTNVIYAKDHGFSTGDAVIYHGTGLDLVDGTTYYVITIDPNSFRLADTYFKAAGYAGIANGDGDYDDPNDVKPISVEARSVARLDLSTTAKTSPHSLARVAAGLEDGRTYYVVAGDSSSTRALSAVRGGPAIAIRTTDTFQVFRNNGDAVNVTVSIRGGLHRIGVLGLDLAPVLSACEASEANVPLAKKTCDKRLEWLRLVVSAPLGGTHTLVAPDGTSLAATYPVAGNGASSAIARGGQGGAVDVITPTARVYYSADVTITVSATEIRAGGDITITADSTTSQAATASAGSGGAITVGETHSEVWLIKKDELGTQVNDVLDTEVDIAASTRIIAGDDLTVTAASDHTASASANSPGGGGISAKIAETTARLEFSTRITIGAQAVLTAGDALILAARSRSDVQTLSETYSVGLGAGADSDGTNDNRGAWVAADTIVTVGAGATITGESVAIGAFVDRLYARARAYATAFSPILLGVAVALAHALVEVDAVTKVEISGNA